MMDNRAGEMQVFVRVVEAGGFSGAARAMAMTPSTISKLMARLEARLGVRLLERSTRSLSLTDEGRLFYERCTAILASLAEAEQEVGRGAAGVLRINASVPFGVFALEPLLPAFWAEYPHIVVDLSLSDQIVDLYLDRTDIAFRVGKLADSATLSRKIGTTMRRIVASPDYLARRGTPQTLDDLASHDCLGFNFRRTVSIWPKFLDGRSSDRLLSGSFLANNGESVRRMAVAGVGLARLGDFHIREDLAASRLVEVLGDVVPPEHEDIHALFLGGPHVPNRVRAFLDFMVPRMQEMLG